MSLTPQEVLAISFYSEDLQEDITIRKFLAKLLEELWIEEEGFSGKRPFGNSGWQRDVNFALVKAGAIKGTIKVYDDGGEEADYNQAEACKTIVRAIKAL